MADTVQLIATPLDAAGAPVTGRTVTFASDNPAVASADPSSGFVRAVGVGTAIVRATSGGVSGQSVINVKKPIVPIASVLVVPASADLDLPVTVPPPAGSNEPAGLTLISDYGFPDVIPVTADGPIGTSGWKIVNPRGGATRQVNPLGGFMAEFQYPVGFPEGVAPATMYRDDFSVTDFYARFPWKMSNPWQDEQAHINKIAFFVCIPADGTFKPIYLAQVGGPTDRYLHFSDAMHAPTVNIEPNVTKTPIALGVLYNIEVAFVGGRLKWWVNGILQGDQPFSPIGPMNMFQFSPTWGGDGFGDVKSQVDHVWYSHVYLSGR